jgi:drug/metabolite transporter (DMT)-like permease
LAVNLLPSAIQPIKMWSNMNAVGTYLLITLATLFWGANFVLAGPVLHDLPPLWAAALRFVVSAVLMIAIASGRGEALRGPARAHAGVYALLGVVGILGFNLLFFFAMQSTSAANGALIMATNPLVTTLVAAAMLGERANRKQWLALPLAFVGVLVVITGGHPERVSTLQFAPGDLLMLGANVTFALYNVLGRRFMPPGSAFVNTTLVTAAGATLLLFAALVSGEAPAVPGVKASLALAVMAVGGTVLAYLFWNTGLQRLGASRTALFFNLVPVFTMLTGAVVGVLPSHAQLFGAVLVLGSVTLAMWPVRKPAASPSAA